jgi:hypothetical protein
LICCRGVVLPVPGAAGVRTNSMPSKSLRKPSSGSSGAKLIGRFSPPSSSRRPMLWSMNCPHVQPHWETPFSENRFCPVSLKTRLLTNRDGIVDSTCLLMPSA